MAWKYIGAKTWYECPNCGYEIAVPETYDESRLPAQCPHCLRPLQDENAPEGSTPMMKQRMETTLGNHKKWINGEADGKQADLSWADLNGANLNEARLGCADLSYANLREANLTWADLGGADLYMANLSGANLCGTSLLGANLRGADLRGADLRQTNIDFSCWPLWCGSFDVKVDVEIARQLAYHFCRLDCDHPEYIAARKAIMEFANWYRGAKEYGRIEA